MRPLKENLRNELASKFGLKSEDLKYLSGGREDSDGILFTCVTETGKKVLKITASDNPESITYTTEKLKFAKYLGDNGVSVGCPLPDENGVLLQTVNDEDVTYIASVMQFIDGHELTIQDLTPETLEEWGRITGRMHALSKKYPIWKSINPNNPSYDYKNEIAMFINWCRNDKVKKHWKAVEKELETFTIDRNTYGFTHNDNHNHNIMNSTNGIVLIDFDCASCHFFASDIAIPVQCILFDVSGGMNYPLQKPDIVKRFYNNFLNGYEKENHFESEWSNQLTTFINYRRCLLFTVMQGWMENDASACNSFISMMDNPCKIEL